MTEERLSPWLRDTRPHWEAGIQEWLAATGRSLGLGRLKNVHTVKERPWAVVRRVTFQRGTSYFKACGMSGRHEPLLLPWLAKHWSSVIPEVQRAQGQFGWILMADAGPPLRETTDASAQLPALASVLSAYSRIQIESVASVGRLLEIGLPDRRVHQLPGLLARLIDSEVLSIGRDAPEAQDLRSRLRDALPRFTKCCERLASSPCAAAIDHGDLHAGNVLCGGASYRICDWGDSCVTHPFCSLAFSLETALATLPEDQREPWARRLRDAYLEPWAPLLPPERIHAELQAALWIAHVVRALDFAHMFRGADEETLSRWQPLIGERLEMWLRCEALPEGDRHDESCKRDL
jgi:hypothetical protein